MLSAYWSGGGHGHPSISILITISIFLLITPSSPLLSPSDSDPARSPSFADADESTLSNNVPLEVCENSEHQASVTMVFMDPPCEPAPQKYCGLRRNQNYTLITIFKPKEMMKAMYVRVTTRDPLYGWETLIWPEFSVCNRFNITCPQSSNPPDAIRTYVMDTLPVEVPPLRSLVRVRLFGVGEDNVKRTIVCRQFKAQVF